MTQTPLPGEHRQGNRANRDGKGKGNNGYPTQGVHKATHPQKSRGNDHGVQQGIQPQPQAIDPSVAGRRAEVAALPTPSIQDAGGG